jgi:hypothetical protein
MKSKILFLSGVLALFFVLIGCQSDKTHDTETGMTDDKRAEALWGKIQGYEKWPSYPGWEGWQESDSVHGDYVKVYVNKADPEFPNGSIVVKEGFKKKDRETLRAITVMERIDGYDKNMADWLSVRFNQAGKVTKINGACVRCHRDAEGDDLIFIND